MPPVERVILRLALIRTAAQYLEQRMLVLLGNDILAQRLDDVLPVRHRLYAGYIDRPHLLDQPENPAEVLQHRLGRGIGNFDARKVRNARNLDELLFCMAAANTRVMVSPGPPGA